MPEYLPAVVTVVAAHPLDGAGGPTRALGSACGGQAGGQEGEGRGRKARGGAYLRFSFQAVYHLMNLLVLCSLGCRQCS